MKIEHAFSCWKENGFSSDEGGWKTKLAMCKLRTWTDPLSGANFVIVPPLSAAYLLHQRPMDLAPLDRALKLRQSTIVIPLCSEQKFGKD